MPSHVLTVYLPDVFPDWPEGQPEETEIEVKFSVHRAEPDVGIMSPFLEDETVTWVEEPLLFSIAQAQEWLDGRSKSAERAREQLRESIDHDDR